MDLFLAFKIMFYWFLLCFITVVLCLKLGNIGSLALFFLRIALFFQSALLFTVTFRVLFSISIQSDIGILTKIN